jgi:hypothetical protein
MTTMMGKGLGALEGFLRRAAAGTGKLRGMNIEQLLEAAQAHAAKGGSALKDTVMQNPGSSAALAGTGALAGSMLGGEDEMPDEDDEIAQLMRRYRPEY